MVDRKTKNNQDLFAGTFEAMKAGEAIGLFPEGQCAARGGALQDIKTDVRCITQAARTRSIGSMA
jgi:1-acyl-sn-glycerol-3-phosphate acyltransferase